MNGGRGFGGNREVSPPVLLGARGDLRVAWAEARLDEGGSWGKHGFLHGSEPRASDAHGRTTSISVPTVGVDEILSSPPRA